MSGISRLSRAGSHPLLHLALLIALPLLVYSNTFENALHLDDFYRVQGNPGVEQLSPVWRHFVDPHTMSTLPRITQYRPLLPLSLSLDHALAGHSLVVYHLTNLGLLMLCGLLCYRLVHRLLERASVTSPRTLALGVALVFVVHPVAGIPVSYVSARDLLLMQLFLLASLLCYVELRSGARRVKLLWALALSCLALSLLSKTNAVVVPLLVLLLELTVFGERARSARPWLRALPFALVGLGFFALTEWVLGFSDVEQVRAGGTSAWHYGLTQVRLHLVHYIWNALWPWEMHLDPLVSPAKSLLDLGVVGGSLVILGSLGIAVWQWRRRPLLAFSILGYWVALAPTSSVIPFHHLAVDYRPLPGSLFFWLALGLGLREVRVIAPRLRLGLAAVLVLYLGAASLWLNRTWRSEESLWRHAVERGGGALAHLNLAMSLPDARARVPLLEKALSIAPGYVLARLNLGRALVHLGQVDQGLRHVERAVAQRPDWAQVHFWAGKTYAELNRRPQTTRAFVQAASLDPRNREYQYHAARWLQLTGDVGGSLVYLQRTEENYHDVGFLLGWALQSTGRLDEAIGVYQRFASRKPDHLQARFNLGHALMTRGRCDDAAVHFKAVLARTPDHVGARAGLGRCRSRAP
jgi:tetratricopeptide (TPR) repeat protein